MTPERLSKLERVAANRRFDLTVVLENVHDPHNIAAVMRTCDAVGVAEIFVIDNQVKLNKRIGKKTSSSANKWIQVHQFEEASTCIERLKLKYQKIYCTHLDAEAKSIYDIDFTQSVALVFGNEHEGVSQELLKACHGNFIIPQIGMISSLNISVACAVTLYECFRQRSLAAPKAPGPENKNLLQRWLAEAAE